MSDTVNLIELGFCVKPHGTKGGFTFHLHNDGRSLLENNSKIFLYPKSGQSSLPSEGVGFEIRDISFGNKVIVYLKDINDRNEVESMIPFIIKVDRNDFPEIEGDDEFYVSDMVGLDVKNHENGEVIGTISDFYENGAQVVFVIKGKGQNLDLPFVDSFFPVVDIAGGFVEIIIPVVVNDR